MSKSLVAAPNCPPSWFTTSDVEEDDDQDEDEDGESGSP
jgi:hypothetical protein